MWKISVLLNGNEEKLKETFKGLTYAQVEVMNLWKDNRDAVYYIWGPNNKVVAMSYVNDGKLRWGYTGN